jgi:hypothetical protein
MTKNQVLHSKHMNLSLCLDKHNTMKTHPVLNRSVSHEDVWGSGSIGMILDRGEWSASCPSALPLGKGAPGTH